jgi:hypothetical protein
MWLSGDFAMLNDVHPPPMDRSAAAALQVTDEEASEISETPIPPPDKTVADVTLFDHPAMDPTGAGNFWGLAIIGLIVLGFIAGIAMFFWVLK